MNPHRSPKQSGKGCGRGYELRVGHTLFIQFLFHFTINKYTDPQCPNQVSKAQAQSDKIKPVFF